METNLPAGHSPSSDTRQGRSEKRAFPRKRVSSGWDTGPPSLSPTRILTRFCWAPHSPFTVVCLGLLSPPVSDLLKEEPAFCSSYQDLSISAGGHSSAVRSLVGPEPFFLSSAARPRGQAPRISLSRGSHSPPFCTPQGGLLPVLLSCPPPCDLTVSDLHLPPQIFSGPLR